MTKTPWFVGARITALTTGEDEITFITDRGTVRFEACSECCDASWFPKNDIVIPEGIVGATVQAVNLTRAGSRGYHWFHHDGFEITAAPEDQTGIAVPDSEFVDRWGEDRRATFTAFIEIVTSAGSFTARMANNHGDSGYYSGELRVISEKAA